jgi:hypothetical protein
LSDVEHGDAGHPTGAPGRPLGRGLEDISHLFLSPRKDDGPTHAAPPVRPPGAARSRSVALLRPVPVTRQRLASILLADLDGSLEEGLRTIDASIPCPPCDEIDLLAVDRAGRLTIVDFETTAVSDRLLLRGLGHFDWILRNLPNVQRMYPSLGADFTRPPRLVLLAPQFSPRLLRAIQQITRPHLHCLRYHTVESLHGPGILFEPVAGD